MSKPQRKFFKAKDLVKIDNSHILDMQARDRPLGIGDVVILNSGGPNMMVVDIEDDRVTTAWTYGAGKVQEAEWPSVCLHRIFLV